MARLIDIEAINWYDDLFMKGENHSGVWVRYRDVEKIIRNATTVDAVPVVRCKECKYYLNSSEKCGLIDTRLHFYETDKRWAEDSFCAWGERKGGDNP
jgi:hypothetical protein